MILLQKIYSQQTLGFPDLHRRALTNPRVPVALANAHSFQVIVKPSQALGVAGNPIITNQ